MSTSQFMRGDPLNFSQTFYLAYTNNSNTYVYCYNSSNYSVSNGTPSAGYLLMTDSYADYDPVLFTISSMGNNTYSFFAGGFYLGINSNNVIDLVSDIQVAIKLSAPSSSTVNIYNINNVLYPSVVYVPTIGPTSYKWYIFNPTSTSNWSTYTISLNTVSFFIFPSNSGQLALWQTTSTYPGGACFYSTTNNNIALEWLYNWTQGTSVNCDTSGTLDDTYNNCYFSSLLACESLYVYNLCTGNNTCGNCQGMIPSTNTIATTTTIIPACYYNVPGSSPPMFTATLPSTLTTDESVELPDTSTNDGSGCGRVGIVILFLVIILFIIIIGTVAYTSGLKKDKTSPPAPAAPQNMQNIQNMQSAQGMKSIQPYNPSLPPPFTQQSMQAMQPYNPSLPSSFPPLFAQQSVQSVQQYNPSTSNQYSQNVQGMSSSTNIKPM